MQKSLNKWKKRCLRADNISIIIAFFDEFGSATTFDSDADTVAVSASEDDTPLIGCKSKIEENLCVSNKKK